MRQYVVALVLLLAVLASCAPAQKAEPVAAQQQTEQAVSEVDQSLDELDALTEDLGLNELEQELSELENLELQ